jgi:hypothetical protein
MIIFVDPGELYGEVTLEFIQKWREQCRKQPVYEVKVSTA